MDEFNFVNAVVLNEEVLLKGIAIETECRDRMVKVRDAMETITKNLATMTRLANESVSAWESIRDLPELTNGNPKPLDDAIAFVKSISGLTGRAINLFELDTQAIAKYDHNILDMQELLALVRLRKEEARLRDQADKVPSDRRVKILRDLKKVYSRIVNGCGSIMNGRYASENVDEAFSNAVYRYVSEAVEEARRNLAVLRKAV